MLLKIININIFDRIARILHNLNKGILLYYYMLNTKLNTNFLQHTQYIRKFCNEIERNCK